MGHQPRILIVDDDRDLAGLVKIRLEDKGYKVCSVHTAKDCLRELCAFRPDLTLLDVDLPEKNGLVLFLEIKEILGSKTDEAGRVLFPVMILTGGKSATVQTLFKAKGVFDYLCKPVNSDILLEKIGAGLAYFSAYEGVAD